jgi:transposase, IS30 family
MSKNYTQLSLGQRYQIEALWKAGNRQKNIAALVGVHPSTVSRELARNVPKRGRTAGMYVAENAQRKTAERHQSKPKLVKFNAETKFLVARQLTEEKWSPELIANCPPSGSVKLSHETIYQWIWECKHSNRRQDRPFKRLHKSLRHGHRRRKRGNIKDSRGQISNRVGIEKRPAIVKKRKRLGDIEADLMMGKNHKGALLVLTDRASLYSRIEKLSSKESKGVSKAIIKRLKHHKQIVQTLTFDNDQAFSDHERIGSVLQAKTYFTRPYTSQDKGTVENRIGVIRRFLPKKTDLSLVTTEEIKEIERKINNRPIRKFKYKTAKQVLLEKIALIA